MPHKTANVEVFPPPAGCHDFPCPDCHGQYLHQDAQRAGTQRYAGRLSDDEAKAKIDDILNGRGGINEIRNGLKIGLKDHGDLFLAKWTKKSATKRAQSLKTTALLNHVPDKLDAATAAMTDPFLAFEGNIWPLAKWLKTKPLSEDRMRLLSLLHLRSSLPPSQFAIMDSRELRLVFAKKLPNTDVELFYNDKCVSLMEDSYGEIIGYDQRLSHSWAIVGFPRALLLLQAQHSIMMFLFEILWDVIGDNGRQGNDKWLAMVESGFRRSGSEAMWNSYTSPAFAPPKHFEPHLLLDMAQTRLRLLLDEFWLMQTDAAYMHFVVRVRKASVIFDERVSQDIRWTQLATSFVQEMYQRIQFWFIIVRECKAVCRAFDNASARRGEIPSADAEETMWALIDTLQGRMRMLSSALDSLIPTMGLLKSRYLAYSKGGVGVSHHEKPARDPTAAADRLSRAIAKLQDTIQAQPGELIVAWMFEILEREIVAQGQDYSADERLFGYLTDIATMDEMLAMCHHNQYGHVSRCIPTDNTPEQEQEYQVQRLSKGAIQCRPSFHRRLGEAMRCFHESPWPKGRKDVLWWEKASTSRAKLVSFWQIFREELKFGQDASNMDPQRSVLTAILFDTDPEYLAELSREKELCEAASTLSPTSPSVANHTPQTIWGSSSDEQAIVRRKRAKAKALRLAPTGVSDTSKDDSNASTSADGTDWVDDSPISVKQDSLSVFSKMYPSNGLASGNVRWQQFAQAMVDAGCTATESAGSAVVFATNKGSICVHKKHPDPTVDPIMLQAIGKRAKKWLGWDGERFVLRVKHGEGKE